MKALLIDRTAGQLLAMPPAITVMADSAITPPGRPVFLPDFSQQWSAEFYLCVKVSRLGKDIAPKFASRYFESVTVAMRLVPDTLLMELAEAERPEGAAVIFDNALTLGQWIGADELTDETTITVGDATQSIGSVKEIAVETIAAVSAYCTLKTGDLLLAIRPADRISVQAGMALTASIDGRQLLSVKLH
ncbi:MAG: fumarylacetoacetate hydrolase family protein [Bacteroides sp.]|nr:fumarylacetoacetate hydrolase family protein [Bacteroides sp.]MCM1414232.1 fumarylacetoacetate hydrolase family protein [Bacteroides sp.]MCM1472391.1 fumarylacetoacetate hydrolase family protein [Bacteroides sp.]